MLTKEIVNWYGKKGLSFNGMVKAADKKHIPLGYLKSAMLHCHSKIQKGKFIPNSDIFRYVVNIAKIHESERKEIPDEGIVYRAHGLVQEARKESANDKEKAAISKKEELKAVFATKKYKKRNHALETSLSEAKELLAEEKIKNKRLRIYLIIVGVLSIAQSVFICYMNLHYWRVF